MPIDQLIHTLRERVRNRGRAHTKEIEQVEDALAEHPRSADLWILRGDLILLCDDGDAPPTGAALESYKTALLHDPDNVEAHLEIGRYYDAVLDDPAAAKPWLMRARELGGRGDVDRAVADVLAQLRVGGAEPAR